MSRTISLSFILVKMTILQLPSILHLMKLHEKTFHVLSFVGMVLCVHQDAFVGGMLRGLAQFRAALRRTSFLDAYGSSFFFIEFTSS